MGEHPVRLLAELDKQRKQPRDGEGALRHPRREYEPSDAARQEPSVHSPLNLPREEATTRAASEPAWIWSSALVPSLLRVLLRLLVPPHDFAQALALVERHFSVLASSRPEPLPHVEGGAFAEGNSPSPSRPPCPGCHPAWASICEGQWRPARRTGPGSAPCCWLRFVAVLRVCHGSRAAMARQLALAVPEHLDSIGRRFFEAGLLRREQLTGTIGTAVVRRLNRPRRAP